MAVWMIRAGSHGEYEQKFIQEKKVFVTWDDLNIDLSKLQQRNELKIMMAKLFPESKPKTIQNWVSQIWPFAHEIKKKDLIILPLKFQRAIQIGEITGDYTFEPKGPSPYFHWRSVEWIGEAIPRVNFGKDLLNTFGAFLTICRIKKHNAEERILNMRINKWKPEKMADILREPKSIEEVDEDSSETIDLEEAGLDQIAKLINAKFKKHDFTRLVEAILKAQGYVTYLSPEGPDGGADILAGSGTLGFDNPRLCVEVKSGEKIDRPTVDKLIGAVQKFRATEGLFVSWEGFKSNVQKDCAKDFFHVRLWTQKEFLEALFSQYDRLDEDIKAELPLKRIWTVAAQDEEQG